MSKRGRNRRAEQRFVHSHKRGPKFSKQPRAEKQVERKPVGLGVLVAGEVQKHHKGFAFLLQKEDDIFIPPEFAAKLLTGDQIKAWINPKTKEVLRVETTKRGIVRFIGTYEAGFGQRVVTLSDRTMKEEVLLKEPPNLPGLRSGHKVLVEITNYNPRLEGKILQSFGPTLAPKLDTLSVVVRSQWPQEFSSAIVQEAERVAREVQENEAAANYKGRKDLREKHFITIDGADARDFDDAILVEKTNSGYVLYVAIADVSAFVTEGAPLDKEAYERATSVYFPEWVIPMLPEALSNGACSLRPNEDKLTLTCEIHYDERGVKRSAKIYESVIQSKRRCIYEDVQKEFDRGDEFWKIPYELFNHIRQSRKRRGSLDLDLPEAKIVLDETSDTIDIKKVERLDAHRVIEEFMIAANEAVTEIVERERWPFVFRIHEPPEKAALERFESFAIALGIKPNLGEGDNPKVFSRFLESIQSNPALQTLHYLLLRSLKQARYDPMNLHHFGLASRSYTHFTSPIRRYPDLIVHRLLKAFVHRKAFHGEARSKIQGYLEEACEHCSRQERKAQDLDRTVIKIKKARFMAKHLGEKFKAKVTNVSEAGIFVELAQWFVEGLVPLDELGDDYYEYFEEKMMIKGKRSGIKFRLSDELDVTVLRTDVENGLIDFTLCDSLKLEDKSHRRSKTHKG